MNSIYQAKRLFIAKVQSVLNVQKDELDVTACKIVESSYGYRLLYKRNENEYVDILSDNVVKNLDNLTIEQNDLIVIEEDIRPLYRYAKSLRICEFKKNVEIYADYISKFFNKKSFNANHENFYKVNDLVRECHKNGDVNKQPLTKNQLIILLATDTKFVEVDELFVVTTKIIDKVERYSSESHFHDYKLAIRKSNGKFIDPLTNTEIRKYSDNIKVGDIIIDTTRPLYRYAKSLRIQENIEDVKTYALFVKNVFNLKEYAEDHSKFYEINELVRTCHNAERTAKVTPEIDITK